MKELFDKMDYYLSKAFVSLIPKNGTLLTFLFHSVYLDEHEINNGFTDPQQAITLALFEEFIIYYLQFGYVFVSPDDILNGLNKKGKYILITFDDGYFNNLRTLPVLKKYNAPALFFISTNHVRQQKCFWWDAVFREEQKKGNKKENIYKTLKSLKERKTSEIEKYIKLRYGHQALTPISDTDRPMRIDELRGFANEKLVYIGNHTANHEIITNLSSEELTTEITKSQQFLLETIGYEPNTIAYPNGNFTETQIGLIKGFGFKLGITTLPGTNKIKLFRVKNNLLLLKRFILFSKDMKKKCLIYNADIHLFSLLFYRLADFKHLIFSQTRKQ